MLVQPANTSGFPASISNEIGRESLRLREQPWAVYFHAAFPELAGFSALWRRLAGESERFGSVRICTRPHVSMYHHTN